MTVKSIRIYNVKELNGPKGKIIKYVSSKNSFFKGFGEVYFNFIKKNSIKGWNLHKKNYCLIKCVNGKVLFHFIDKREKEKKITLSSNQKKILMIPPNIWFSFKSLKKDTLIVNLINNPHKDNELMKKNIIKKYFIKN